MGNIGSQTVHKELPEDKWASHSFPRNQPVSQHKVLPERDQTQKLRSTNNGEILHNGGTLSGRQLNMSFRMLNAAPPKTYLSNQKDPHHKSESHKFEQIKRYDSEPNLHTPSRKISDEMREKKYKKKYRAPSPPNKDWERDSEDEQYPKRNRLFKTKAESKKTHSSPLDKDDNVQYREKAMPKNDMRNNRLSLPEISLVQSAPTFQEELKEVLRNIQQSNTAQKLKTLDHHLIKKPTPRGEGSGKESSTPEQIPEVPKTFYFGMDPTFPKDDFIKPEFISNMQPLSDFSDSESVDSASSNNIRTPAGINLQLRPILPKRQLEIPRFSPAAAWKQLSSLDTAICSMEESTPPTVRCIEEPMVRSNDKSGDSGISGDDCPKLHESWTPLQDLDDDSTSEVDQPVSALPNNHMFSLSLPRDHHFVAEEAVTYQSLQKLKVNAKKTSEGIQNDNWFFSKSAPNSLNTGINSLDIKNSLKSDDSTLMHHQPNSGRLMYLPEIRSKIKPLTRKAEEPPKPRAVPEDLQDPPKQNESKKVSRRTKPRFTFQSTVRQIERKRIADKLSREAEKKEQQRLRELEAMQRVEEEFQKKRAREKASIREQLRLFSMDDSWSSLPPDLQIKDAIRPEPDGAVSSSAGSLPSLELPQKFQKNKQLTKRKLVPLRPEGGNAQVLCEYRQSFREYKEHRSVVGKLGLKKNYKAQPVKVKEAAYRRDVFAARPVESVYSDDSRMSPSYYHSKNAPITRF